MEGRVGVVEDTLPSIKKDLQQTRAQIKDQAQRLKGLENKQRRKNVCILGLPLSMRKVNLLLLFKASQDFLRLNMPIGYHLPPPGNLPRPVILILLNYRDRSYIVKGLPAG